MTPISPIRQAPAPQHGADLVISDVQASDPFPTDNEPVYFDVVVKNQGDVDAPAFNVRLSSDGLDQKSRIKDGLKAGASATIHQMGPLWTNPWESMYWVSAVADPDNEVQETRKDNNETDISLMPQPMPQPPPEPPIPPIPHPPV